VIVLGAPEPLACQEMVELITDYLEGALPRAQRRRFESHLKGCEHCSEYLAQMRAMIAASGRLRAEELTPSMRAEFSAIFVRWRAEQAGG
jgi:anti-sigma factor RsiW